jgi:outer membrane protein OmpA-like peptidoglycan-associated protein
VLRDDAKPQLDQLVAVMKAQPKLAIRIEASTDAVATPPHNLILSGKQALAVRQYLVAAGVDGKRIEMKALGATIPIAPNTTPLGRAQNRRIEIVKTNT